MYSLEYTAILAALLLRCYREREDVNESLLRAEDLFCPPGYATQDRIGIFLSRVCVVADGNAVKSRGMG